MKFRFLGTGTSVGVPQIGCDCPVCTSADPRDKRRRCGAYVSSGNVSFLIDTPPELRLACVECGVKKVDAVLLTHAHMDHVAAFDDIRRFNTINGTKVPCSPDEPEYRGLPFRIIGKPISCYAMPETIDVMHQIFPYISAAGGKNGLFRPQIEFVDNTQPFWLGDLKVEALRVGHSFPCCGYLLTEEENGSPRSGSAPVGGDEGDNSPRSGSAPGAERLRRDMCVRLGYISDCHDIPEDVIARLQGVDVMVLNCLRVREHPTHLSLARAKEYLERIAPKKAYLIHMCHDFTHAQWLEMLAGTGIEPAYDGLELQV